MRLRRRVAELEARIATLEAAGGIDYTMPTRPTIDTTPVEALALWRERCADYATVNLEDVDDDRTGMYL